MRCLIALALSLLPLTASSGFYKWQGPDGQTYYSDRPVPGAEPLGIKAEPTNPAPDGPAPDAPDTQGDPGPYEDFQVLVPESNQTLRDPEGKVDVSLLVNPALDEEARLEILLDGQPVAGTTQQLQLQLRGVIVGTHRLQARILNSSGEVVASSPAVSFHMRKALPEDATP